MAQLPHVQGLPLPQWLNHEELLPSKAGCQDLVGLGWARGSSRRGSCCGDSEEGCSKGLEEAQVP